MIAVTDLIGKFQYAMDERWGYIYGASGGIWTQAQQNNATREQTIKWGQQWVGHHVADCSGLFSWAFKQLGGYMYHGSNTMYLSYCVAHCELSGGRRTDGEGLKPGTAVFTWKPEEKKYGHVGLYIGDGKVIEAYGTQKGVITSNVTDKRWTHWGELKGVAYEGGGDIPDSKPTLRKGSKGEYVTLAQTKLIQKGYDLGKWGADGSFGTATETAVKAFQQDNSLTADGIIGAMTWNALEDTAVNLYSVSIPHLSQRVAEELIGKYGGVMTKEETA